MKWIPLIVLATFSGCVTARYAELRYWEGKRDGMRDCSDVVMRVLP